MGPTFCKSELPRYTQRAFPPYRYLPFQSGSTHPHPRSDPAGHSYGRQEDYLPGFMPADWRSCEAYLYGVDLFNHAYWWEAHEALEAIWLAAGRSSDCGRFVQGLIQLSAAQLKRFTGELRGARSLTQSSQEKLSAVGEIYLGIKVAPLLADAWRCLEKDRGEYPRIELNF